MNWKRVLEIKDCRKKMSLIDSLDEDNQKALIKIFDTMLTNQRIKVLVVVKKNG